jgi:hypothetical protein
LSCFSWKFSSGNVLHRTSRDTVATGTANGAALCDVTRERAGGGYGYAARYGTKAIASSRRPHRP